MFLMDNRQANRDWDGSLEQMKGLLTKHGAEIVRCDKWGERKLAYEIDGRRRATYVVVYFNADGDAVGRMYRECELSELILRVMVVKIKTLPSEEEIRKLAEASTVRHTGRSRHRDGGRFRGGPDRDRGRRAPRESRAGEAEEKPPADEDAAAAEKAKSAEEAPAPKEAPAAKETPAPEPEAPAADDAPETKKDAE
jgi:ribosomal protein S6